MYKCLWLGLFCLVATSSFATSQKAFPGSIEGANKENLKELNRNFVESEITSPVCFHEDPLLVAQVLGEMAKSTMSKDIYMPSIPLLPLLLLKESDASLHLLDRSVARLQENTLLLNRLYYKEEARYLAQRKETFLKVSCSGNPDQAGLARPFDNYYEPLRSIPKERLRNIEALNYSVFDKSHFRVNATIYLGNLLKEEKYHDLVVVKLPKMTEWLRQGHTVCFQVNEENLDSRIGDFLRVYEGSIMKKLDIPQLRATLYCLKTDLMTR